MVQRARLARGVHPLMPNNKVHDDAAMTCGSCRMLDMHGGAGRTYYKYRLIGGHSIATDVRLQWPGCEQWKGHT